MPKINPNAIPIEVLLDIIEVIDDKLHWKEGWRKKYGLSASKKYTGEVKPIYIKPNLNPTVLIHAGRVRYNISFPKLVLMIRNKNIPSNRAWFKDGDKYNLSVSNITSDFIPWWERKGLSSSIDK